MSNEIDEKKTKYFVIAIILLIVLSIMLVIHFNNKSLVSGEEDIETTTTTTTTTTTKKTTTKRIIKQNNTETKKQEITIETLEQDEEIYKTTIDKTNKLIYSYKTTNEINASDTIISKILTVNESLKNNNIISIYDISLYDSNMNKKIVNNSKIDISIPITDNLLGFDEYKVVYIDENNNITNEEFDCVVENGYIKFSTTHLSKFGVLVTKKELDNATIDIKINNEIIESSNMYVNSTDRVEVLVNSVESEYKLYYLLKDENNGEYKEFNNYMFDGITTPSKFILYIKLEIKGISKIFEIGNLSVYDIVFKYDKTEEITEEDIIIGKIEDEEGNESKYIDEELNKDIVIDNIENEVKLESDNILDLEETSENNVEETKTNDEQKNLDESLTNNEQNSDETSTNKETEEDLAKIILKGNIYLVEETDISNLEITGYLIIDTNENIIFATNEDKLLTSNIYTITIKSKEFSLNGVKYTYEYINNDLIIKKVEDGTDAKEEINILFKDFQIITDEKDLILANPYN